LEIKTDLTWNEYKNKRYFYTSMNWTWKNGFDFKKYEKFLKVDQQILTLKNDKSLNLAIRGKIRTCYWSDDCIQFANFDNGKDVIL
jgi:hypothetical protein